MANSHFVSFSICGQSSNGPRTSCSALRQLSALSLVSIIRDLVAREAARKVAESRTVTGSSQSRSRVTL